VRSRALGGVASALLLACTASACTGVRVTDPRTAAITFTEAAAHGDAETVYAMLSPTARRALSRDDVSRLLKDESAELSGSAKVLSTPAVRVATTARLRFADGEQAALEWTGGRFGVTAAGSLPGGAATPEAALDELRRALARRSYPALLRLLSPSTRSAVEQDLRTLVGGLEHPDTLPIHTSGDSSNALVPGGHHVSMKRDAGVWHVEDFD